MGKEIFGFASGGSGAEIYVLVPLRDAERNASVEVFFGKALGRGVHCADEFVIVTVLFIEQRGGVFGIEAKSGFHGVSVVGEVIHLLRKLGMEDFVAVGQGD